MSWLRQHKTQPVVLAVVGVLDSIALAVLINVATGGTMPVRLAGLRPWVWPAIVVFGLIGAVNAVVVAVPRRRARPARPDDTDNSPASRESIPLHVRARNLHFTGRQRQLDQIRHAFVDSPSKGMAAVACIGLGGVGKTELAIEYAHRFASEYRIVCVLSAETPATLEPDLMNLATALGLPVDRERVVERVLRWLRSHDGWLLVFDNAPSLPEIVRYLPSAGAGHVLITSRHPGWRQRAVVIPVDTWTLDESVEFLCSRLNSSDHQGAAAVAGVLGRLPLALEQAAGYMDERTESFLTYVRVFEDQKRRLLSVNPPVGLEYQETVATTWAVSITQLETSDPAAADLLRLCAFLAPDSLDETLFEDDQESLPTRIRQAIAADQHVSDLIGALNRYSLVKRDGTRFSLHRLVQEAIRLSLSGKQQHALVRGCLGLLAHAAGGARRDDPAVLAHTLALLPHATEPEQADAAERLLRQMGAGVGRLIERGGTQQSINQARMITDAVCGQDNPAVARVLAVLGKVLAEQGSRVAARACFEQALAIALPVYGANDPEVILLCTRLAGLLRMQDDIRGADEYMRRATGAPASADRLFPWRR